MYWAGIIWGICYEELLFLSDMPMACYLTQTIRGTFWVIWGMYWFWVIRRMYYEKHLFLIFLFFSFYLFFLSFPLRHTSKGTFRIIWGMYWAGVIRGICASLCSSSFLSSSAEKLHIPNNLRNMLIPNNLRNILALLIVLVRFC